MKQFLQSLGTFAPQTIDAIINTIQYAITSRQITELQSEMLMVTVAPEQQEPYQIVSVFITDYTEESHNSTLGFCYNHEGEFFSGICMATEPKPEPKLLPLAGLLGLVLSNSQQKG